MVIINFIVFLFENNLKLSHLHQEVSESIIQHNKD